MNIVYSASRNLYPHLEAPIKSLLAHNKVTKIYVLAEDDELPFEIPCKHEVINVSGQQYFRKDGPNMRSWLTYMAMMRACLPDLIKANKVISLDVDTVVCDSLEPLWNIPLKDKWMAWCPEYKGQYNPWGHEHYYNLGVTVFNLAQMRKDGVVQRAVDMLNNEHLLYLEQEVFNMIAVPDKCVDIPVRFNESFCCGYTDNPAIVHYAGASDWFSNPYIYRREFLDRYLK